MRCPDPDVLFGNIPERVWRKWKAWMRVRGPIGGARMDNYATYLAIHSRQLIGNKDGSVDTEHLMLPWMESDAPQLPAVEDPYDTYVPERDGEVYL